MFKFGLLPTKVLNYCITKYFYLIVSNQQYMYKLNFVIKIDCLFERHICLSDHKFVLVTLNSENSLSG